jgi:hypothetical protein
VYAAVSRGPILEGGRDNSSVYNFALVNFLAFGFDVTL